MSSRVSFVLPCYNYAHFVGRAIDSLLEQTYPDIEIIVIDDASTDDTATVLAAYESVPHVRVVRHERNMGHIFTYNQGLSMATGDYLGLMSADDFCLVRNAVERQVTMFEAHPNVGMVFSSHVWYRDGHVESVNQPAPMDYVHTGVDEFRRLMWEDYVPASGTLLRRDVQSELGLYDPALPHAGDWDMWLRAATKTDIGYIAEPLFGYCLHPGNMHHARVSPAQAILEVVTVLDKAFAALPTDAPAEIWASSGTVYTHGVLQTAWTDLFHGRLWRTLVGLAMAVRVRPVIVGSRETWGLAVRWLTYAAVGRRRGAGLWGGRVPRRQSIPTEVMQA